MKKQVQNSPKTAITTLISAIIVYSIGKGWIGQSEAELISQLLVVVGVFVNWDKLTSYLKQK